MSKYKDKVDIIRTIAIIFLITLMGYNIINFDSLKLNSNTSLILLFARTIFISGVPLLFISYGHEMSHKKFTFKFYNTLLKLAGYFLILNIVYIIGVFCMNPSKFDLFHSIKSMLSYTNIPMIWICEILVSLFLIVPLLNNCWNNSNSKKEKFNFLMIFFAICILPTITNAYIQILPEYFVVMYPLLFYFIGAWIRDYELMDKIKNHSILIIVITIIIAYIENINFQYGSVFLEKVYNGYGSWSSLFISLAILGIISRVNLNKSLNKVCELISKNGPAIFIFSYLAMQIIVKFIKISSTLIGVLELVVLSILIALIPAIIVNKILKKILVENKY